MKRVRNGIFCQKKEILYITSKNFGINCKARTEYQYARASAPAYNMRDMEVLGADEINPKVAGPGTYWSYDADTAGQTASQRAIDILKKAGLRVKILRIPGAKDPDEFIKAKGAEAFRKLIERSDNDIRYRIESARDKYDFTEDDQRILFLREAAGIIAALEEAGVCAGDTVCVYDVEFEFVP